ncbi:MAG: FAD:protein FMN transferase [Candidatus Gracilibacteria bacterium]|nr:FAD:protein FMN transferase [Candidatus Gracilibacteria bacterium]
MEYKKVSRHLGTDVEISVITDDPNAERRINGIFDFFVSFEQEFSRFLPSSKLSLLNKYKVLEVSERFIDLLKLSKDLHVKTDGYFNPLVDISKIGYSNSFEENIFEKKETGSDLNLDSIMIRGRTIILKDDQHLDFGGIGKGYAVGLASEILKIFGYDDFFINAGGDIYASGFYMNRSKWVIGIENPFDGTLLATISLSDKAIATSGNNKRKWEIGGDKYHHILDPKTNSNNFEVVSVSIISDKTYKSDAFTKAVYNMEAEKSIEFMEKNNLSGVIILASGKMLHTKDMVLEYDLTLVGNIS